MDKTITYPYPVPAYVERLNELQTLLQHDEKIYSNLIMYYSVHNKHKKN